MTRYVDSGGIHIACQVLGAGERDIVFVPGAMSHLDLLWEDPETAAFFRRLSTLGRLILFDKRDTGLSDRAPADSPLEERIEDVRAVMGAASSSEAVLFGYSEGAPMSILFAATHPERVTALILGAATARQIDVRSVLPAIHVPTLVIQRLDDRMTPPCHGHYLASQIAGARYFEQPGDHSLRFAGSGDSNALINEIGDFLTGAPRPGEPDRVLATILFAEAPAARRSGTNLGPAGTAVPARRTPAGSPPGSRTPARSPPGCRTPARPARSSRSARTSPLPADRRR